MQTQQHRVMRALLLAVVIANLPAGITAQTPTDCQMVTTRWSQFITPGVPASGLDGSKLVVQTTDVSAPPTLPGLWNPSMSAGAWTAAALGQVFGLTIDDATPANVYVAATTCYGNYAGDPNQFGPGGAGAIYRIDGVTGAVTTLITLPNNGPALGNLSFAPGLGATGNGILFATNLDDGQLYSIALNNPGPSATIVSQRTAFGGTAHALGSFAPRGDRPYAIVYNSGEQRVYFSIWQGQAFSMAPWSAAATAAGASGPPCNSIWSLAVDLNGNFIGTPTLEICVPHLPNQSYSHPVTDISMSSCEFEMLVLAERTFFGDYGAIDEGHQARVLRYNGFTPGQWNPSPNDYYTGSLFGAPVPMNSAGGVDLDTSENVYATADLIGAAGYGVQRVPVIGNTPATSLSTSLLIGFPGAVKAGMGDVEYHRNDACDCETGIEPCDREDVTFVLNTGWDQQTGTLIPAGQTDDDWEVTRDENLLGVGYNAPHSNTIEPALGLVLAPPTGAWALPGSLITGEQSQWLHSGVNHNNTYVTYQYCFCLRAGFSNPQLNVDILGDDAAELYVNGFLVGSTGTPGFSTPTSFSVVTPSLFMAGQNCIEVRVRNDISFAGVNVVGTMTAVGARCCCTAPPRGLVGWWPLDGLGAGTAIDLLQLNNGGIAGPSFESGRVGSSLRFDTPDRVEILAPDPTLTNLQRFSIDAWVKLDCETPCPLLFDAPIFNRRATVGGAGFELFVAGGGGFLGGRCTGSAGTVTAFQTSGPDLLDNDWHLVVMTFDGNGKLELWLDGVRVASATGTTGSLVAPFPEVWIGGIDLGSQVQSFRGWIDEVEVFDRVLTPREIRSLNDTPVGKCRDYCYVPAVLQDNGGAATVPVTICNTTGAPVTYSVDLVAGGNCSLPGLTATTPLPMTVIVAPGCTTVSIATQLPAGSGDACYTVCVTNGTTGSSSCCPGLIRVAPPVDVVINDPVGGIFKPLFPRLIQLQFTNNTTAQIDSSYSIEVFPVPRDGGNGTISLDGLPPGEPVRREVGLPPRGTAPVDVEVIVDRSSYTRFHDLVFFADFDGDGEREPIASFTIEAGPPQPTLRVADASVPAASFTSVDVLGSASAPIETVALALATDPAVVELIDVDISGTALAAAGVDFFMPQLLPAGVTVHATLTNPLLAGTEHTLVRVLGVPAAVALPATTMIDFTDGTLGTPPVSNELGVAGTVSNATNGLLVLSGTLELLPIEPFFLRGDCNDDGGSDIGDTIYLLAFLFGGGSAPNCDDACDLNDDGGQDIADAVYELTWLFNNGPPPPTPSASCGADPTADSMGCGSSLACP